MRKLLSQLLRRLPVLVLAGLPAASVACSGAQKQAEKNLLGDICILGESVGGGPAVDTICGAAETLLPTIQTLAGQQKTVKVMLRRDVPKDRLPK